MRILLLLVLILNCASVYGQRVVYANSNSDKLYDIETLSVKGAMPPGLRMKRIGTVLTIIGGASLLTGTL